MFHNFDDEDDFETGNDISLRQLLVSVVLLSWVVMAVIMIVSFVHSSLLHEIAFMKAVIPGAWNAR